jgi:hypothetical protein
MLGGGFFETVAMNPPTPSTTTAIAKPATATNPDIEYNYNNTAFINLLQSQRTLEAYGLSCRDSESIRGVES